jgi:hypothetical protein
MKTDIKPRIGLLIILFITLITYSLYQARTLLLGPQIWVDYPQDGHRVDASLITVTGRSKNIAWFSLNDRQIFTDKEGRWNEQLLVGHGVSIITLKAKDRFNHETTKHIQVVLN